MDPYSVESTTRKYLMLGIVGVTAWRIFLVMRQMLVVLVTTMVPQVLAKGMTQADFTSYRQVAVVSLIGNGIELIRGAVSTIMRLNKGYPAWIWSLTANYANSVESRTVMYPIIEIVLANWLGMIFIILIFLAKWNLLEFLSFHLYVVYILVGSTALTYGVIFLTKMLGPAALLYAAIPLNVLEMLNIIAVIELLLPTICTALPPEAKKTLNPVAKMVNFPSSRIYMIPEDAVDYSPNAAYMGLMGFKIIVITESLLKSAGLINTRSVLAHELGHWARGHMAVGVTTRLFQTILTCFLLAFGYGNSLLFQVFGFQDSDPPHPAVGVLISWQYIVPLFNAIVLGISTTLSYFCEYQADRFAVDMGLGEGLITALTTLMSTVKRYPIFDSWYAAWFIGHPDILDRVDRIMRAIA